MSISIRRALIVAGGCAATMALLAAPASARSVTLHFFEKNVTGVVTGPAGQPVNPNAMPVPGDKFDSTNLDYAGNHKHHAARYSASTHVACTITSPSAGTCSAQFAQGSSMLLANNFTINFTSAGTGPIPISEGTGKFRGVRGTVTVKNIPHSNNSDTTIKITNLK
jgi:hypothetical protein